MAKLAKQGQAWTSTEHDQLKKLYNDGLSVFEIAEIHQRTPDGILAKLEHFGMITRVGYNYHRVEADPYLLYADLRHYKDTHRA